MLSKLMLLVALFLSIFSVSAQDFGVKWGATPEAQQQNVINFNFLRDAINNRDYAQAAQYIPGLIAGAPASSQNLYIWGIRIYENKLRAAQDPEQKKVYIDSLMMMYDLRIQHFGDTPQGSPANVLPRKAQAYLDYRGDDRAGVKRLFEDAIAAAGENVDLNLVNIYFREVTDDYKADVVSTDEYMAAYEKMEAYMNLPGNADKTQERGTFETLFISSGAANCENLEQIYAPRLAANPDDLELLEKVIYYLNRGNCFGDFYGRIAETYYEKQPSTKTALSLAAYFENQKNFSKALEYLRAAIQTETDPNEKYKLCVRISLSELGSGNSRVAADFARQGIALKSDGGLAHYALAQAYGQAVAKSCSGFDLEAAYWLVYDQLQTASRYLTPEDRVENIGREMANYRANFPSQEECFFRGLNEGDSYRVTCGWVTGNTTVRQRK